MELLATTRDWLSQRPYAASAVLIAFTLGTLYMGWNRATTNAMPPHPSQKVFVFDELTGDVSVRDDRQVPPIVDGDHSLVQAVFYTFDHGKTRKLAYLQKYSEEAKAAFLKIMDYPATAGDPRLHQAMKEGTFIRLPEPGAPWVLIDSAEATMINARALQDCPRGAVPEIVRPD